MSKQIKVMIVEDNKLIRVGIRTLFNESEGYDIVAEADNGKDAVLRAINTTPDIILLDIGLPDMSGLKLLEVFREKLDNSKIIILSSNDDINCVNKSLSMGVFAYVIKDINTESLLHIVKSVNTGAMWLDPKIVPYLRESSEYVIPKNKTTRAMYRNTHSNLTQREYEVLKLVVDGKSNNDIALELCISEHTAKAHVCNIIQKLLVDERTQAAVKAIKEGLV